MRFDLRLELADVRFSRRHLTRDRLDETAIQLESLSAFLEALGCLIDLELHHRDRVSLEEDVGDLVQLRPKSSEEFPHDRYLGFVGGGADLREVESAAAGWVSPASSASERIFPR